MEIKVYDNNVEKALQALKRRLQKEGLFKEIRRRRFHEKPSEKKKRKRREAIKKGKETRRFYKRT